MELYPLDIVIHIINIAVLYFLLRMLLYRPISNYLQARSARIEGELAKAQQTLEQAEQTKQQLDQRLAAAEEEARAIVRRQEEKAAEESARLLDDARKGADEIAARGGRAHCPGKGARHEFHEGRDGTACHRDCRKDFAARGFARRQPCRCEQFFQ